ncbi:MAG: hypothetical protein K6G36_00695 [Candidatus Saccharibacteria bacterium]|nr:hypothetical protein [Candidatus Saccharibacteria bacterium]
MKRLVIIDGKSVFYRGYYAMGALSLSDGTPTGGIYGFAAIAMEIVSKLSPNQVVVAWDSHTSGAKRREIYPEYKAGRVKPGDDFYAQIPLLKELIDSLGWTFIELDNYEADDIIGTLSLQADNVMGSDGKCEYETYIISSDLDMLQIVDENTRMWRILKGFSNIEEIDVAEVEAKYGILKSQFLDMKALKGDASDNIPGVPGIGEKTAVKLLNDYGTLDGIYEHIDEIGGSIAKKLIEGRESAYMSLKLAKIMFDAPVKLADVPEFKMDQAKMIAGLKRFEFNSLVRKYSTMDLPVTPEPVEEVEVKPLPKDLIVDWDIKALMHSDSKIATKILMGAEFWDLNQGHFLLDPLARDFEQESIEKEYWRQKTAFEQRPELYKIFVQFDLPLIPILFKMEKKGMLIDRKYFDDLKNEYTNEVARKEREVQLMAGVDFNVNSPVQLSEVLFDKLGLPTKGIKKTSRGYSTGAKELDKLKDLHPLIPKLMEYREAAKLLSTYILPMPELADSDDRIHTTFTQNVTATGRLSSLNPNLQNIPVRTEEGKRIRTGFVAPAGKVLVSADYSQFELRLAAALSGDQKLIDDFNSGIDIHTKTASEAFKVPFDEVTKKQRRAAKVINFGVLYGMSAKGLADAADMSVSEAKAFIDKYFELRAPIRKKLDEILKQAREMGYVETFFGRRRPTPDVKSANFLVRAAAERAAQNMPIQGTEADLMKRAMTAVDAKLPKGASMIMQVHDSLIVECDEAIKDEVSKVLKDTMEAVAPELNVKLAVDVTVGQNWGEL